MKLNLGSNTHIYVDFEFDHEPVDYVPAVLVDGTPLPASWEADAVAEDRREGLERVTVWTRTCKTDDRVAAGPTGPAAVAAGNHIVQGRVTRGAEILVADPHTLEVGP